MNVNFLYNKEMVVILVLTRALLSVGLAALQQPTNKSVFESVVLSSIRNYEEL